MSCNRDPETPCHRVIRADGRVGGFFAGGRIGGTGRKIAKLRREGIKIDGERIDLGRYRIRSPKVLIARP